MFLHRMQPPQRSRHGCQNSTAVHAWLPLTLVKFLPVILVNAGILSSIFSMPAHARAPQRSKVAQSTQAAIPDFEQAKESFRLGSLDDALAAVQRGLARSPSNVDGLNLLGMIYHQQQRYAESVTVLQKALRIEPRSLQTLNNLAIAYSAQQKLYLAEQTLRKILLLQPRNRMANYNLGLILLAQHKPKEAILALQRVKPPDGSTLLNLTQAFLIAGMNSEALRTAQLLSRQASKDVKLHFSLGVLLASKKQLVPAIREFEIADALNPGTFEILHNLGQGYLRNNQPGKAQSALEQALTVDPQSAEVLYLLAQAETDQRKDVEALELLVRARKLAPQNTDILLLMARLSMKQGFYEDAIPVLNDAIKLAPRRPELHAALGESYFTIGKTEAALEEFKSLLQLDSSSQSYAFMGLCYRHLGKFEEAKQYFQRALKADPENIPSLFNLGYIARRQGNRAEGEQYLSRALRLDPSYSDALFEMGSLKLEEKKYAEAIPMLRRCAEVSATPGQVYYKLAAAERNLHQMEAAERDMKIFLTLSKNPEPGPYPRQNVFDYIERRGGLSAQQRTEANLHELEIEVQQHPDRPRSLYLLAEADLKLNHVSEAMQILDRLDKISERDFRTLLGEGVLLAGFQLYPAAIEHFQAALAANPSSDEAAYDLANAYFQNHDDSKALQTLQQVSVDAKNDGAYLALLGDVYMRLGRTGDAAQVLRKAILTSPDNDEYYLSLALAQLHAGDTGDAYTTLQRGLARVPDSGILHWGAGVTSVVQGDARRGETYLKKAVELAPRESAFMTLGVFYYEAGRINEAREVLRRCSEMFPKGSVDVAGIGATLDAASVTRTSAAQVAELPPHARQEFYQIALQLAERDR